MSDAPGEVEPQQLRDLHIAVSDKPTA